MKYFLPIFIILGLLCGGVITLASTVDFEEATVVLSVQDGEVKYAPKNDDYKKVENEVKLLPGMKVFTEPGAQAVITFFDKQQIVLSENTEVEILQADYHEENLYLTEVEIAMTKGRVWSQSVYSINPQSRFCLKFDNLNVCSDAAVFDTLIKDEKLQISVFKNSVEITNENDKTQREVLELNEVLNIFSDQEETDLSAVLTKKFEKKTMTTEQKKDDWIRYNLIKNEEFEKKLNLLKQKKYNQVKISPDSKFYKLKKIAEKIKKITLRKEEKKNQYDEDLKYLRALEYEVLFNAQQYEQAEIFLQENDISPHYLQKIQRFRTYDVDWLKNLSQDKNWQENFIQILAFNEEQKQQLVERIDNYLADIHLQSISQTGEKAKTVIIENGSVAQKDELVAVDFIIEAEKNELNIGQSCKLHAYLKRANKKQEEITPEVVWTLTQDGADEQGSGLIKDNVFYAGNQPGQIYINAYYGQNNSEVFSEIIKLKINKEN